MNRHREPRALSHFNRTHRQYNNNIYRFSSDAGAFIPQKIRSAVILPLCEFSRTTSGDELRARTRSLNQSARSRDGTNMWKSMKLYIFIYMYLGSDEILKEHSRLNVLF